MTTEVTAPGPNDHGSVTARRGHSSVTARSQLSHGEVTAQSRHLQYDHGSVTARSQLNYGPGHGSITAGCDHFGHRVLHNTPNLRARLLDLRITVTKLHIITEAHRDVICLPNILQRKLFTVGTFQVLLLQGEIQFMHTGIQTYNSNAQNQYK